jgi:hypothetical protein
MKSFGRSSGEDGERHFGASVGLGTVAPSSNPNLMATDAGATAMPGDEIIDTSSLQRGPPTMLNITRLLARLLMIDEESAFVAACDADGYWKSTRGCFAEAVGTWHFRNLEDKFHAVETGLDNTRGCSDEDDERLLNAVCEAYAAVHVAAAPPPPPLETGFPGEPRGRRGKSKGKFSGKSRT